MRKANGWPQRYRWYHCIAPALDLRPGEFRTVVAIFPLCRRNWDGSLISYMLLHVVFSHARDLCGIKRRRYLSKWEFWVMDHFG